MLLAVAVVANAAITNAATDNADAFTATVATDFTTDNDNHTTTGTILLSLHILIVSSFIRLTHCALSTC